MTDWSSLTTIGLLTIIIGFLIMFAGILRSAIVHMPENKHEKEITVKGGGVVFIGPVPIIFGTDKRTVVILVLLAIVLTLLLIILNK